MDTTTTMSWGTWEELLLSFAVKRHGPNDWDSVALELHTRTAVPPTALSCRLKYLDLRRRFNAAAADPDAIPWIQDLTNLRLAELRRDLQRYDASITSLQSKVKRLEEERERSGAEPNVDGRGRPDLDGSSAKPERDVAGKSVSGEREDRSVNESNSSAAKCEKGDGDGDAGGDREPARTGSKKPDPAMSGSAAAVADDSCDGSSEPNRRRRGNESSSDVQSSASRWRKEAAGGEDPEEMGGDSPAAAKSRALVGILEAIRRRKQSSLFERRLESQESDKYKRTIRQHVDLETIEKRIEQGSYSSCSLGMYRDLMLLFNNAIVFFPKSSPESISAHQLRDTVSIEMHKQAQRPDLLPPETVPSTSPPLPKPQLERLDSLLAKRKSSAPIIVCRKRSSIEKKPGGDPKPVASNNTAVEEKKAVTGTRTMRRNVKNPSPTNTSSNKKQNVVSAGTLRTEKKKAEAVALASDKKKSAADFLKRIKRNSPVESPKSSSAAGRGGEQQKNNSAGKKERVVRQGVGGKQAKEESSPAKRSVGRPPKKAVEAAPAKRARGEAAGKESSASKVPKKRARR